jgi:hypothetical protein
MMESHCSELDVSLPRGWTKHVKSAARADSTSAPPPFIGSSGSERQFRRKLRERWTIRSDPLMKRQMVIKELIGRSRSERSQPAV